MKYRIRIDRRAAKAFAKLPGKIQRQVGEKIDSLTHTPFPDGVKKLSGKKDLYRIRSGDYRIVYTFETNTITVYVLNIGDRKDIYKSL